jgi:hypothetical protein
VSTPRDWSSQRARRCAGNVWTPAVVYRGVTIPEIHEQIDRLSERRGELWRVLGEGFDAAASAELKQVEARLEELWAEHRATRAHLRFGGREKIVARARAEERLERAAA